MRRMQYFKVHDLDTPWQDDFSLFCLKIKLCYIRWVFVRRSDATVWYNAKLNTQLGDFCCLWCRLWWPYQDSSASGQ